MSCRIVHEDQVGKATNNQAEREMLAFLRRLPDDYLLYCELAVQAIRDNRVPDKTKRPDFVVVGPDVGVFVLEVKDWNLQTTQYHWLDQNYVERTAPNGSAEKITNPQAQANGYQNALREFLNERIWITSVPVFPRLTRTVFLNAFTTVEYQAAMRAVFDVERALFRDDLDAHREHPEKLLRRRVSRSLSIPSTDLDWAKERLLPTTYRIGGQAAKQQQREQFRMLSQKQERFVLDDSHDAAYWMDVAGSGKTTGLIAKAVHLVQQGAKKTPNRPPKVLITTYSARLRQDIQAKLSDKLSDLEAGHPIRAAIHVRTTGEVLRQIAAEGNGTSEAEYETYLEGQRRSEVDTTRQLHQDVEDALNADEERFRVYSAVFVDEVQDLSDFDINILSELCATDRFFFVGDRLQKLTDQTPDPDRHDLAALQLPMPATLAMYRTPRYVAELAHAFARKDSAMRSELAQTGHAQPIEPRSPVLNGAELISAERPADELIAQIRARLSSEFRAGDQMVITSAGRLNAVRAALSDVSIAVHDGLGPERDAVTVVEFKDAKGLERLVVFVLGIEDLPDRHHPSLAFKGIDAQLAAENWSRRAIYVALTRTIEECVIIYSTGESMLLRELRDLQREIEQRRLRRDDR